MNAALSRLHELDARHLWVSYHDYSGVARAKALPSERFDDACDRGVTFATANWDLMVTGERITDPGFGLDSGDFRVLPDAATIVPVPYRPGVFQAFGPLLDGEGRPWEGDPRARLIAQVEALAALGLAASVAFEAEFSLISPTAAGGYELADQGRMFTTDELDARWPLIESWLDAIGAMGVPVHQVAKEWGPAQYEISLLPADPLVAVERYLLVRQAIRALSRQAGLVASFMPKAFEQLPGNGLHVHIGLADPSGRDVFGGSAPEEVSSIGEAAIAGLIEHAAALSAVVSATPNSYKRLKPGSAAPAHICWALGNRSALVRIPGPGDARRIEYRAGDATSNAYMLLGGLLAAVVDGVFRQAHPPPPVEVDPGQWSVEEAARAGVELLPLTLTDALAAFEADAVMAAAFGPTIMEHYPAVKRFELERYAAGSELESGSLVISNWERQTYLEHI